jgi:hypothetical protein
MIKKLLCIIVLSILLSTNANAGWFGKWSGYVYPDASDLTVHISAGTQHASLEDCRNACNGIIRSNNWQNADYECGYKCKFKNGINICKETSR